MKQQEVCLQLIIYYDELTITNSIGNATTKNKLGLFYFTLTNFPPLFRSHLDFIFLLAVCKSEYAGGKGIDSVLRPLIDELNTLSNGITESELGSSTKLHVAPLLFVGDTPALYHILAIKESVGASYRKCRQCFASREDFAQKFEIELFRKRTIAEHRLLCAQVEHDILQGQQDTSIETGITRYSAIFALRSSLNFDPFTQSPQDLMIVLLEGIIPFVLKHVFQSIYNEKRINRSQIREMEHEIRFFKYHQLDKDSAPVLINLFGFIDTQTSCKLNAVGFWMLIRMLPFYSFTREFESLPQWRVIKLLLKLCSLLMKRSFNKPCQIKCKSTAQLFIRAFMEIFPNINIIPKFHYLLHCIADISRLGPPST